MLLTNTAVSKFDVVVFVKSGMMDNMFFEWIHFRKNLATSEYRTFISIYRRNMMVVIEVFKVFAWCYREDRASRYHAGDLSHAHNSLFGFVVSR